MMDELTNNVRYVYEVVDLEEIENQFFLLCKDFESQIKHPKFNLESL
ncbi:MAG: hypothetical protein V2I33_19830 [Kangiellaceae bacterium]|jgi:hypothetical protein|nr:hypothetical protein [Kangiellaceae bacterium]